MENCSLAPSTENQCESKGLLQSSPALSSPATSRSHPFHQLHHPSPLAADAPWGWMLWVSLILPLSPGETALLLWLEGECKVPHGKEMGAITGVLETWRIFLLFMLTCASQAESNLDWCSGQSLVRARAGPQQGMVGWGAIEQYCCPAPEHRNLCTPRAKVDSPPGDYGT